jgi:hypothetical protein
VRTAHFYPHHCLTSRVPLRHQDLAWLVHLASTVLREVVSKHFSHQQTCGMLAAHRTAHGEGEVPRGQHQHRWLGPVTWVVTVLLACCIDGSRGLPAGLDRSSFGPYVDFELRIPFSFPGYFQYVSNFQHSYQIHLFLKIHETSSIILLNSRSIKKNIKPDSSTRIKWFKSNLVRIHLLNHHRM